MNKTWDLLSREKSYMRVPEGVTFKINQICKFNKGLYGLKQT